MKKQTSCIYLIVYVFSAFLSSCDKGEVPSITTTETTQITGTSAIAGGTITAEGSGTILARGVCWSTSAKPNLKGSKTTDGAGAGSFTSEVTGLEPATQYFIRAYATNDAGTGYGMTMSFTTPGGIPGSITNPGTVLSASAATLNGVINPNYISTTITFEYGTTTSYGNSVSYSGNPVTGSADNYVSADISGLLPATLYHYRIKAVNSQGTMYGEDVTFTTLGNQPTVLSSSFSIISATRVELYGTVNPNYLSTVVTFEYGTTTDYNNSVTATLNPLTENIDAGVKAVLTDLTVGLTYHFRLKAVNDLGTSYSNDKSIELANLVFDIDGNAYQTVIIGSQEWMVQNLRTTRFNDGTEIPNITGDMQWSSLNSAAFCWYDNNAASYKNKYGALYNWYSIENGILCPVGWHVPTDPEWSNLEDYLSQNGFNYDGSIGSNNYAISLATSTGWTVSASTGSVGNTDFPQKRNATGFSALPGGVRDANQQIFGSIGNYGMWWTASENNSSEAWDRGLASGYSSLGRLNVLKSHGFSVRCLKD